MVFASLTFLFLFLPAVLLLYFVTPKKWRNITLLAANLLFYAWGEPRFLLVILFSTCFNFCFGRLLDKYRENARLKKAFAAGAVAVNLGLLVVFKYTNFFVASLKSIPALAGLPQTEIPLPLGISFYTFHVISYIVDIYRGDAPAQKSIVKFGVYITLFPQMIAGPIVRYKQIQNQLTLRDTTPEQFAAGIRLLLVGLAKKVLIANQMGVLWDVVQAAGSKAGLLGAWAGAAAFTLQIYFDFSGYSDMARGLGRLFGFELPVNFNYPYISKSVTDFWRRWHMTLSQWFRDYVYIPLGGSRSGMAVTIRNLLVVWALTGFWHGANWNFLLWGLYYFVLLTAEKLFLLRLLEKAPRWVGHVYAGLSFLVGWMLFALTDLSAFGTQLQMMFGTGGLLPQGGLLYQVLTYLPLMAAAVLGCTPLLKQLYGRLQVRPRLRCAVDCVGCVAVLVLCTAALLSQSYNPFLYFRF